MLNVQCSFIVDTTKDEILTGIIFKLHSDSVYVFAIIYHCKFAI
jgi:hypothetical protein